MRRPSPKLLPAALAALLLVAAPLGADAQSRRYGYRVELAETAKKNEVRAGGVTWQCRQKICIAQGRGGNVSVRGCTELARQVGRVVTYRSEIKQLADEQLAACNAEAAAGPRSPLAAAGVRKPSAPASAAPAAAAPARAAAPAPAPRVTTQELSFTGVHAPAAGR